jgi:hypothetical protein
MFGGVKMLRGVFVLRGVAAANVTATQAQTQMRPSVAHFEAFFATLGLGFYFLNLIEVGAGIGHAGLL